MVGRWNKLLVHAMLEEKKGENMTTIYINNDFIFLFSSITRWIRFYLFLFFFFLLATPLVLGVMRLKFANACICVEVF